MADSSKDAKAGGGLLDLENELSCSICTDILYQPLTLLDCLHTFCGSCLKEWFSWQATAAVANGRTTKPYTCPSCRESVRDTKADWRTTTLLDGFLKANPDRAKSEEDKEEMRKNYKPGENVIPPLHIQAEDSDDERLMADVRELSMADVDPSTARRRAERARERRRQERRASPRHRPEESSGWAAQQAERLRDGEERHVEHQPSLRSLLSDSEINSQDVQEEILQSIYSEGLLNGIDVDNLTPQQEEELTERIAEAYRRRQRQRERSRNRERSERNATTPQPPSSRTDSPSRNPTRRNTSPSQQPQSRARPPVSRPHLFEQPSGGAERRERRSASSTSHHRQPSETQTAIAARSATDLSQNQGRRSEESNSQRPRASSSTARSTTDPVNLRSEVQRVRNRNDTLRPDSSGGSPRPRSRDSEITRSQTGPVSSCTSLPGDSASPPALNLLPAQQAVRPATSNAALAPEVVSEVMSPARSISCTRCERAHIESRLHYNCSKCDEGNFNLCRECYRAGKGCHHWFGFGFMAMQRWQRGAPAEGWPRGYEHPHVLMPRQYTASQTQASAIPYPDTTSPPRKTLQEGAFCETCSSFADDCYWYCEICLDGAWGFCNPCVLQGRHCTHPLLPLAHISKHSNPSHDPSQVAFLPVPHLRQHSYVLLPVLTDCDVCHVSIPPNSTRFHCYQCGDQKGDYDICNTCCRKLVSEGQINPANGPNGWRRCPQGHRMAIVGYQDTPYGGGQKRITIAGPVGGWRLKEESITTAPPPTQNGTGLRFYATWSWFPSEESKDELPFPKNAEIREGDNLNEDWAIGVYAGRVGMYPSNHTDAIVER